MRAARVAMIALTVSAGAPLAAETVAITAARMIDVETGRLVSDPVVIATDGRITAMGTATTVTIPAGARRIDLAGLTLLPGLNDMHVHLTSDARLGYSSDLDHVPAFNMVVGVANAARTLDAGVYPHGDNARQFAKMVEWGMTPIEAIQAATRNAGVALGMAADVGTITVGRYVDMIAVAGDPLRDVTVLQTVLVVIKGGTLVRDAR